MSSGSSLQDVRGKLAQDTQDIEKKILLEKRDLAQHTQRQFKDIAQNNLIKFEAELARLRQVKFYLSHPLGKQEYDAYLSNTLDKLKIGRRRSLSLTKRGTREELEAAVGKLSMDIAQRIHRLQSAAGQ